MAYCPPDDVESWTTAVLEILTERAQQPARLAERRTEGVARAAVFSWARYASQVRPALLAPGG